MIKRIGFACKWIDRPDQVNGLKPKDEAKKYNTGTTTIAWLNRQTRAQAEQKLWELMTQNIEATRLLVERVGNLDDELRWRDFWQQSDVQAAAEKQFAQVGDLARSRNVRLSMHPGQFTVLASDDPDIVNRSIEEFEYHATMARWMGFGKQFQDFKINVHISGRQGPEGIRRAHSRLSPEARNTITIENEENAWGLDDCLTISDIVPIVLDVHHHWVREGEYLDPNDARVTRVIDSWRNIRPTMHYSVSREDILAGHCTSTLPNYRTLLETGHKKQKLRAHSDFYWNTAVNQWVLGFRDKFDIMCESKAKNLASLALYEQSKLP
jgi:UV DNA damage repair endonuclease